MLVGMATIRRPKKLEAARAEFLAQWGALGPAWGVSRGQIALVSLASYTLRT